MDYTDFFRQATGYSPFPYQTLFAVAADLPDIVKVPTGAGKTATAVLGWMWRRFHAEDRLRLRTPIRLVYCLPMRVLVEQTLRNARNWAERLGLEGRLQIHLLMGGEDPEDWHLHPEKEAILVGTQDMLLSRALNRGYGASRFRWPIDFGLLSHDCLWILDEVQLMGSGLATTAQLEAFRQIFGTFSKSHSVWMSATLMPDWLATVDFEYRVSSLSCHQISCAERTGALKPRLEASKKLAKCEASSSDYKALALTVHECHEPSTSTMVIVNTVSRAVALYAALKQVLEGSTNRKRRPEEIEPVSDPATPTLILLHSRFRRSEKREKINRILDPDVPPGGMIAVVTQVVEAGVDVSARHLFTDLAPWPSLVQRFGRCNRKGEYPEATVQWIDILTDDSGKELKDKKLVDAALPYDLDALIAAREQLEVLEEVSIRNLEQHLEGMDSKLATRLFPYEPQHLIRKRDILELFDTTPDLAGNDVDISRFIRDGEDLDASVFWRSVPDAGPPAGEEAPTRDELCPVRIGRFAEFVGKNKRAFRWNHLEERWTRVRREDVFPGQTFLVPSEEGGYDTDIGWDPQQRKPVEIVARDLGQIQSPDANDKDALTESAQWQLVSEHGDLVAKELSRILDSLGFDLPLEMMSALVRAARMHDWGKAHEVFVKAAAEPPPDPEKCWAKMPRMKRYHRRGFRHELAGALAMLQTGESPLACYLVASHHGKVRLSIRSLPIENRPPKSGKRFARGIWDGDVLPAVDLGAGIVTEPAVLSLEPMELGLSATGNRSWADQMLRLRDASDLGPFRLAFLEALLRAADVRASQAVTNRKNAGEENDVRA